MMWDDASRLLALHGFLGDGADWEPFRAHFAALGLELHAPTLPGHASFPVPHEVSGTGLARDGGLSALAREGNFDAQCRAFHASLTPCTSTELLMGYSLGGRIALSWLAQGIESPRGAVIIGARPGFATEEERARRQALDEACAERVLTDGLSEFLRDWDALDLFAGQHRIPDAWRSAMRSRRAGRSPEGIAESIRTMGAGTMRNLRPALRDVRTPILVVWGEEDETYARLGTELVALLPDASAAPIPRAGHRAHLENHSSFVQYLSSWWHGVLARESS